MFVGQIQTAGIGAFGHEQVLRQGNGRMRGARRLDGFCERDRIGDQGLDGKALIADLVDERRIGAVFQQAAHQIGQQRLMRADRGVDPARAVELLRADNFVVERLAHAVQALELVVADLEVQTRQRVDRGQRAGVMGRELWEDDIARREEFFAQAI